MYYSDTGQLWNIPSPALTDFESTICYCGGCFAGRHFLKRWTGQSGAVPDVRSALCGYAAAVSGDEAGGGAGRCGLRERAFIPTEGVYQGQVCFGLEFAPLRKDLDFLPTALTLLRQTARMYPEAFTLRDGEAGETHCPIRREGWKTEQYLKGSGDAERTAGRVGDPERRVCKRSGTGPIIHHGRKNIMKLSTTVNFFIYDDDGSYEAYKEDLRHYAAVGYQALDAIFCQADAAGSPLRTAKWMGLGEDGKRGGRPAGDHVCADAPAVLQFLRSHHRHPGRHRRNFGKSHCLHENPGGQMDGGAPGHGLWFQPDGGQPEKKIWNIFRNGWNWRKNMTWGSASKYGGFSGTGIQTELRRRGGTALRTGRHAFGKIRQCRACAGISATRI